MVELKNNRAETACNRVETACLRQEVAGLRNELRGKSLSNVGAGNEEYSEFHKVFQKVKNEQELNDNEGKLVSSDSVEDIEFVKKTVNIPYVFS